MSMARSIAICCADAGCTGCPIFSAWPWDMAISLILSPARRSSSTRSPLSSRIWRRLHLVTLGRDACGIASTQSVPFSSEVLKPCELAVWPNSLVHKNHPQVKPQRKTQDFPAFLSSRLKGHYNTSQKIAPATAKDYSKDSFRD